MLCVCVCVYVLFGELDATKPRPHHGRRSVGETLLSVSDLRSLGIPESKWYKQPIDSLMRHLTTNKNYTMVGPSGKNKNNR